MRATFAAFVSASIMLNAPALAGDLTAQAAPGLDASPAGISIQPAEPPTSASDSGSAGDPASSASAAPPAPIARAAFGTEGSQWLWAGYGVADNFTDAVDQDLYFAWSTFLAQDVELGLEAALWYFNQPGDNEAGLSGTLIFRWHFIHTETWTVYLGAGIGVMGATGNVPDDGTSFDLMPRVGIGITKQLTDDGLRLDMGVRWHHISNARIFGDDNNPSRDGAMLYVGLIFPF